MVRLKPNEIWLRLIGSDIGETQDRATYESMNGIDLLDRCDISHDWWMHWMPWDSLSIWPW